MANKDTSKGWFETGDYPTQAQFAQVFEWLRWKDEQVGVGDLSAELVALLNSISLMVPQVLVITAGAGTYTIPAGYAIHRVYAKLSGGLTTLRAGSAANLDNYMADGEVNGGITRSFDFTVEADVDRTVYFNLDTTAYAYLTESCTLKIYLHKI
jgi:hypothetical protein